MDTNGDLTTLYITVGILIVITCLIIVINGTEHLSRKHKRYVYDFNMTLYTYPMTSTYAII